MWAKPLPHPDARHDAGCRDAVAPRGIELPSADPCRFACNVGDRRERHLSSGRARPDVPQNLSFVDSSPELGQSFPGFPLKAPKLPSEGGLGGPAVRSGDHLASGRVDTVCPVAPTSTSALVRVRLLSVLELPIQTEQVILVHAQRHVDHHREPDRVTSTLLTIQVRYIVPVPRFSEFCRTSPSDLRSRVSALIKLHPHT